MLSEQWKIERKKISRQLEREMETIIKHSRFSHWIDAQDLWYFMLFLNSFHGVKAVGSALAHIHA